MKTTQILLSILPTLATANVGLNWNIANVSSSGLKEITFPIAMPHAKHEKGIYFAQQFEFSGANDIGYTGLQPSSDTSNNSIVHAVFSSFVPGTTSTDKKNCNDGADGGPGVSCAVNVSATYSHTYNLVIKNTHGTTWTGTLVDAVLGNATHIGSYTLPTGTGGIKSSHMGFLEYFLFNAEKEQGGCSKMPRADVTFWPPRTNISRLSVGKLEEPYPYGGCEGEDNFRTTQVGGGGYRVTIGFV